MSAPTLPELFLTHWQISWSVSAEAVIVAAAYLGAALRVRGGWPAHRTVSFLAGLGTVLLALESGLDTFDDRLLSVHMTQHLLLLLVAPLLLIGGRPVILALRTLPPRHRRRLVRGLGRLRGLTGPVSALAVYCAVLFGTHLPAFYDATLRHPLLHDTEHGLYLLAGTLMLWPILDGDPAPAHRLSGLAKFVYLLAAMLPMAVIGAYLNRYPHVVYAPYGPAARALGVSALDDQATAGAIMWVVGNTLMVFLGLYAVIASLVAEERRQQLRDARVLAGATGLPRPEVKP